MAIEEFVTRGAVLEPPSEPQGVLAERAGTFVTLRRTNGQLRGCIGTVSPSQENVAREIIHNAIRAATADPRFSGVTEKELPGLLYGVDVLSPSETVQGPQDLNPSVFGVIIETLDGSRRGLLLPDIEGVETVEQQWLAVHEKSGIIPGTPVRVQRFSVTRFGID